MTDYDRAIYLLVDILGYTDSTEDEVQQMAQSFGVLRAEERERVARLIEAIEDQRFGYEADVVDIATFIRRQT